MQKSVAALFSFKEIYCFYCFFLKEALGLCSGSIKKCVSTGVCRFRYFGLKN